MSLYIYICKKIIGFLSKGEFTIKKRKTIVSLYENIIRRTDDGKSGAIEYIAEYAQYLENAYISKTTAAEAELLLRRAETVNDTYYIALAHKIAGTAYTRMGKPAEAEKHLSTAEEQFRELSNDNTEKNIHGLAATLYSLSNMYSKFGKTERIETVRRESMDIFYGLLEKYGNIYLFPYLCCINDLSAYYSRSKLHDKAYELLNRCYPIVSRFYSGTFKTGDKEALLLICVYYNLAGSSFLTNHLDTAKSIIDEAVKMCRNNSFGTTLSFRTKIFKRAAIIYDKLELKDEARHFANEAEKLALSAKKLKDFSPEKSAYKETSLADINLIGNMDSNSDNWTILM